MSVRDRWRALRGFVKSYPLFRTTLRNPARALLLPFRSGWEVRAKDGRHTYVPGACWTMLPTVCRLLEAGAAPSWVEDALRVEYQDLVLFAPPLDKSLGTLLREVFVEDVYGVFKRDVTGQTVLDVGAYIGDSAVAYARRGARVHAFEPVPLLQDFCRRNIAANAVADRVLLHPVGLSDRDETLRVPVNTSGLAGATVGPVRRRARAREVLVEQEVKLVHATTYLESKGIRSADILKLDCEGCEYGLLGDGALIEALRPVQIVLEYHRGGKAIHDALVRHGYRVRWPERSEQVGYMQAEAAGA